MQSLPTAKELVISMLYDDGAKTLDQIYAFFADAKWAVTKMYLIRLLVDFRRQSIVRFLYEQGWPETRFVLDQEGFAEAYRLGKLNGCFGYPRNN